MNRFNASRTGIMIPPRVVQSSVYTHTHTHTGFLGGSAIKVHLQCRRHSRRRFDLWVRKVLWRRAWQPTSVFLPGKSHGLRSLVGYGPWGHEGLGRTEATGVFLPGEFHGQRSLAGHSPWSHKELDTTEQLSFSRIRSN